MEANNCGGRKGRCKELKRNECRHSPPLGLVDGGGRRPKKTSRGISSSLSSHAMPLPFYPAAPFMSNPPLRWPPHILYPYPSVSACPPALAWCQFPIINLKNCPRPRGLVVSSCKQSYSASCRVFPLPAASGEQMDLGLSIGGREARKMVEAPLAPRRREWVPEGDTSLHPPLQLELKLSWPDHNSATEPQPRRRCGLPEVVAGPAKLPAVELEGCNDVGPSPSSSRSTAGGWKCSDEEGGGSGRPVPRKKLRLTKDQSSYLEESFKEHATLNPKQKLAIAKKLNLRPRQVEVWFQNRRARTKLKQTEVEYEYMKRCCESLAEENRRLRREIQELRALKVPGPHLRLHLPATTLSICPSCERTDGGVRKVAGGFGAPMTRKLRETAYPKIAFPVS